MAKNVRFDITAFDRTKKAFNSIKRRLGGVTRGFFTLKSAALAFGLIKFGGFVKNVLDAGDQVQKLSIRLGTSTEALSQLKHVASLSGNSFEALTKGMTKLQKSASDASVGLSTPKRAFEQLGISVDEFKKLDATGQLMAVADALENIKNPADRTRIAMDLMGRSGADLISMMDGGSEAIKKGMAEADALGQTLTRVAADEMALANDALTRLGTAFDGVTRTMAVAFGPALASAAEWLANRLPGAIEQFLAGLQGLRDSISNLVAAFAQLPQKAIVAVKELYTGVKKWLGEKMLAVFDPVLKGVNRIEQSFAWLKDKVTGNSYVPDMVDEIASQFGRLDALMVNPAEDATKRTAGAFEQMGSEVRSTLQGLASSIAGSLGGAGIGGNIARGLAEKGLNFVFDSLAGAFGFARGGVMTSKGPKPLKRYARGGIANRPQMAMFGEGSRPEAFVPLPDGRSIPVQMRGGGGGNTVYHIDARGAEVGVEERIRAVLRQERPGIINQAVHQSIATVEHLANQGGSFSKALGRR